MNLCGITAGILLLFLFSTEAYARGITTSAFHVLTTKSNQTIADVLELAGPPDLTRESIFGNRIFLYYIGEGFDSEGGPRHTTTVIIDGKTDRVITIERRR